MRSERVVIIGGGIAGLSAAYYLNEFRKEFNMPLEITLLEGSDRLGGVIQTVRENGFCIEDGPDCFGAEPRGAVDLCKRLGIQDDLIGVQPENRRYFLLHEGRLFPMPKDILLFAPMKARALLELPFMSLRGKLRMAAELFIKPETGSEDESLGQFITRRFGAESARKISQPLLGSIFSGNIHDISLNMTFGRFKHLERQYGSVIKGLRSAMAARGKMPPSPLAALGPFLTFEDGLEGMVQKLIAAMPEVKIETGATVRTVRPDREVHIELTDGRQLKAQAVCLATPAARAAEMLREGTVPLASHLQSIPMKSMLTVHVAFQEEAVKNLPRGTGFVSSEEDLRIMGCTFSSLKFANRAPQGQALLRAVIGGAWCNKLFNYEDDQVAEVVIKDIERTLGIQATPSWTRVARYFRVLPQYAVGHMNGLAAIEKERQKTPGLFMTGNTFKSGGISGCIDHAKQTAEQVVEFIRTMSPTYVDYTI